MVTRPPAPAVTPLRPDRYKVQFTAGRALTEKLRQAQDLLRGTEGGSDLAAVVERAVDSLLRDLRRRKYGAAAAPRPPRPVPAGAPRRRRLPRATRRAVAARDQGRCAYVDPATGKRCSATAFLHFHHRQPWARGGSDDADNVALFCATHDGLQAEVDYGGELIAARRAAAALPEPPGGRTAPGGRDGRSRGRAAAGEGEPPLP